MRAQDRAAIDDACAALNIRDKELRLAADAISRELDSTTSANNSLDKLRAYFIRSFRKIGWFRKSRDREPIFSEIDVDTAYSKEAIARARGESNGIEWATLEEHLRRLPITSSRKAERFLAEMDDGENYSRASSLTAAACYAAVRTGYNEGSFAELVRRISVLPSPIPYIAALHSWKGIGASYGTKVSFFVRTGQNVWLCAGRTGYDRMW